MSAMQSVVRLDTGETLREIAQLGEGGQGRVWTTKTQGKDAAVKMYFPQTGTDKMRANISRLISLGSPHPDFIWPITLVEDRGNREFGYLMELAEKRFVATEDFLARRVTPNFQTLMIIGWKLANAFLKLHSSGHCYRDISFGNIRFDPNSGEVRILDNDNVTENGDESVNVSGTQRFMAPEIVRGEAFPNAETDRYSLAVLLFVFLMGGHPLDGLRETAFRCMNLAAMKQLYGFEPIYIFDPKDASNRPDPTEHRNPIAFEPIYPESLKKLFLASFTDGLVYPQKRVTESVWGDAFDEAADLIFKCSHCKKEVFYKQESQPNQTCWKCKNKLVLTARLRTRPRSGASRLVMLPVGKQVYGYHVENTADRRAPVGVVVAHPADPSRLGLKNLTQSVWNLTRPDGAIHDVAPGQSVPLVSGNKINFGAVNAEIEG
jgi:eukaryotic-like serine/threonine-protein kinase